MMKSIFIEKINSLKRFLPLSITLLTGILSSTPAQALQFQFIYAQDTSQEVIHGFQTAGNIWSSKFKDTFLDSDCSCEQDITVKLHIDFTQISNSKALGATSPHMVHVNYEDFLNRSFKDITSTDDLIAFKNLQNLKYKEKDFFEALGVELKDDKNAENISILQQQGFELNLDSNNIDSKSKDIIADQAPDIFQQLNLEQVQNLKLSKIDFEKSAFKMRIDDDDTVKVDERDKVDRVNQLDVQTIIDKNENDNNKKIWLTLANAKALGLSYGNDEKVLDALILMNNSMFADNGDMVGYSDWIDQNPQGNFLESTIWDFSRVDDPNAEVANNKFDFLSVALHEIGHALGFVSGVDAFKLLKIQAEEDNKTLSEKEISLVSSMDLFRFSDESTQNGVIDWSSSDNIFFSIDGGETKQAEFADGVSYQTSHWSEKGDINGNPLGIMHPVLGRGEKLDITDLDLQLLDVLGYTKVEDTANRWLHGSVKKQKKLKTDSSELRFRIRYNGGGSSSSGLSFWQELGDSEEDSGYSMSMFFNQEYKDQEYKTASTPEPNIIMGMGFLGIFGWLHRRMRPNERYLNER